MPDLWLTCAHFMGKVSVMGQPTRPTQSTIPLWPDYMDYWGGDH